MTSHQFFLIGCLLEAGLFLVGALLCAWFGDGFLSDWHWNGQDALRGLAAVVPLWGMFYWTSRSRWKPLAEIRRFLEVEARPWFRDMGVGQLLGLSALAGLGEEFFFRGAIQGGLSSLIGIGPALVLGSLIFGLFHPHTWGYLILTALIGMYLGWLWLVTGNLLVPVVTHAVYDFVALWYFQKMHWNRNEDGPGAG